MNSDNEQILNDIADMAITSIQISLTDVLHHLGIYPDNVVGYSLGEVGKYMSKPFRTRNYESLMNFH